MSLYRRENKVYEPAQRALKAHEPECVIVARIGYGHHRWMHAGLAPLFGSNGGSRELQSTVRTRG